MSTVNMELAKSTLVNEDSRSRMVPLVSPTSSTRASRTSCLVVCPALRESGLTRLESETWKKEARQLYI
jgi:hypothetical protein